MLGLRPRLYRHVAVPLSRGLRTRETKNTRLNDLADKHQSSTQVKLPPQHDGTIKSMHWLQRAGLYGALALAGLIGFYSMQLGFTIMFIKPCTDAAIQDISQQKDVASRYNETADNFDGDVNLSERLMGILSKRKALARKCQGHVLEVSCGTGRNLGYFDLHTAKSKIKSLTFVDVSPQMVHTCMRKWAVHHGRMSLDAREFAGRPIRFFATSALEDMPLAPDEEKYDTILQTMGLCSTPAPIDLLSNMANHLNPTNPEARIFLMEHGRSYREWLNTILDSTAEKHAEIHGCWYNRDIGQLVEAAAAQSGLEVVKEQRQHFGTTWMFELRFDPDTLARRQDEQQQRLAKPRPVETPLPSTWKSWLGLT